MKTLKMTNWNHSLMDLSSDINLYIPKFDLYAISGVYIQEYQN